MANASLLTGTPSLIQRSLLPAPYNALYGSFGSTLTQKQTGGVANTPTALTYNTTFISNGVAYDPLNPSRIIVNTTGVYKVAFSLQLDQTVGGTHNVDIWLRINGNNVALSNSRCVVNGNKDESFPYVEFIVQMTGGQWIECVFMAEDKDVAVTAFPSGVNPATSSIITNVVQIA